MQGKTASASFLQPYNFLGVPFVPFGSAAVVVAPVPYDATTSWKTGARGGPAAIISASRWLETYDEELDADHSLRGFHTMEELEPEYGSPQDMAGAVKSVIAKIFLAKKFPLLLGGDHSVSIGAFQALKDAHPGAGILYFDAHPDLRPKFEGTEFSHACSARRAFDLGFPIVQVGIRAVCEEDAEVYRRHPGKVFPFYARERAGWDVGKMVSHLPKEVYISFDVDAFDSSLMPATGTPEPGGLSWDDAISVVRAVAGERRVVGADVTELSPIPGMHACDFLAAKLAYRIAGFALESRKRLPARD